VDHAHREVAGDVAARRACDGRPVGACGDDERDDGRMLRVARGRSRCISGTVGKRFLGWYCVSNPIGMTAVQVI